MLNEGNKQIYGNIACGLPDIEGDCVHPGCEGGVCVPIHTYDDVSTPCYAGVNPCATAGCEIMGQCNQDHIPTDSTIACGIEDIEGDCVHPGCEGGVCVPDHTFDEVSSECMDTDQDLCTQAGCEEGGICNQEHIQQPYVGSLTRTPGFWCQHDSVTDLFLPVWSCGIELNTTSVCTPGSAVEDLVISNVDAMNNNTSPKQLQLIRQCAAAALNFAASAAAGYCCADVEVMCWKKVNRKYQYVPCDPMQTIADVYTECCDELCTSRRMWERYRQINVYRDTGLLQQAGRKL